MTQFLLSSYVLYKRKQKGEVPMKEGRSKLKLELYIRFAKHFIFEDMVSENFTNTWAWNLMCRSMNISGLTASALSWAGDCIAVEYGMTKTKKKNVQIILKHLFANPFQPEVFFPPPSFFRHPIRFLFFRHPISFFRPATHLSVFPSTCFNWSSDQFYSF